MKIVERMFEIMESKDIKNVELANYLNVNKSVISNWKTRNTDPPAEYIVLICKLLNVSTCYLLTGKERKENLSEEDKILLEKYNLLTEKNKGKVEYIIDDLLKEQKINDIKIDGMNLA